MSRFTRFEEFELVAGSHATYRLIDPVVWEVGAKGSGWQLTIAKDTTFEISVPRWLEWAQSPHDRRVLLGAAIHDELLNLNQDRAFASAEFRRANIARNTPGWWAWVLFGVTLIWTVMTVDPPKRD